MKDLIIRYIDKLTLEEVNSFAIKNDIYLSKDELLFTFNFIKRNGEDIIINKTIDINNYKEKFSEENFIKISKLIIKYQNYL